MNQVKRPDNYADLKKVLLFITILAVILSVLSYLVEPSEHKVFNLPDYVRTLENTEKEKENTIDVIFTGDSEASDGFSPLQFWGEQGISSYNIANPAQIPPDSYALMAEIVKRQNIQVLVFETSCLYLRNHMENDDPWLARAEKVFPIFRYHQIYRLLKPKDVSFSNVEKTESLKGFWLKTNTRAYDGPADYMGSADTPAEYPMQQSYEILDQFLELCRRENITLLLVSVPQPEYWDYGKHNGIQEWADAHSVPFIDMNLMNDTLGMDWTQDTSDGGNHLSFSGTVKVCSWLGKYLKENYHLTDHRGDPLYDSWQSAYDEMNLYGGNGS